MVGPDAFRTDSVWPSGLLPDGRVTYFWDSKRIVGRCFGENLHPDRWPDSISIVWDAFYRGLIRAVTRA